MHRIAATARKRGERSESDTLLLYRSGCLDASQRSTRASGDPERQTGAKAEPCTAQLPQQENVANGEYYTLLLYRSVCLNASQRNNIASGDPERQTGAKAEPCTAQLPQHEHVANGS